MKADAPGKRRKSPAPGSRKTPANRVRLPPDGILRIVLMQGRIEKIVGHDDVIAAIRVAAVPEDGDGLAVAVKRIVHHLAAGQ